MDALITAKAISSINMAALAGICKLKSTNEWIRMDKMPIKLAKAMPKNKGFCLRRIVLMDMIKA